MFKKVIEYIKKLFKINSNLYLLEPSTIGLNNNSINTNLLAVQKFDNIFESDNSNIINENKIKNYNYENNSSVNNNSTDSNLFGINLLDYALKDETDNSLKIENNDNDIFHYDIYKVDKMNQLIDYYKKNLDKLFTLPLEEILEINFYYKKRIEILEKKVKQS